jgi:hypothetical protein
MAGQTGKCPLGDKLLQAQAAHRGREPEVGNPQLPAGIEGGVARLVDAKIGEYKDGPNKGQPFFMASGVVGLPVMHAGQKCAGLRTQIGPEALCDTPTAGGKRKTAADHYGWMRDQLLVLGFDLDKLKGTADQVWGQILSGIASMTAAARARAKQPPIWFRFRTWKGGKQVLGQGQGPDANRWFLYDEKDNGTRTLAVGPDGKPRSWPSEEAAKKANPYAGRDSRVQHDWCGACDAPELPQVGGAVDNTAQPSGNGQHVGGEAGSHTSDIPEHYAQDKDVTAQQFDETDDTFALLEKAKAKDEDAQNRLIAMAVARGHTEEEALAADSWDDVMAMLGTGEEEGFAEDGSAPEPPAKPEAAAWMPKPEEVYLLPNDPKTGKTFRNPRTKVEKPIEVEVVTVNLKDKTCKVKSLADAGKTVYDKLPWDALQQ